MKFSNIHLRYKTIYIFILIATGMAMISHFSINYAQSFTTLGNIRFYHYDSAGNRISRTINLQAPPDDTDETIDPISKTDAIGNKTVVFSYDSRSENISLRIQNFESDDNCLITLYSLDGVKMDNVISQSIETFISTAKLHPGIYVLHVILNGESSYWKIVK